jgi:hypothetical protein
MKKRMKTRLARALIVATLVAASSNLGGCSADPTVGPGGEGSFAQMVSQAITDATEGGASQDQIAILEQAKDTGSISLEDDRRAARAAILCLTQNGTDAEYSESTSNAGVAIPGYVVTVDGAVKPTAPAPCETKEFYWVNMVYQLQPSSQEATDANVEKRLPILRTCLIENGANVDESTTKAELLHAAVQLLKDTNGDVDCARTAGIDAA